MKLFLDDVREAPDDSWIVFRPEEYPEFLQLSRYATTISFDHDLGEGHPTGYDLLCILEEKVYSGGLWALGAPKLLCHSMNPVGIDNINKVINSIYRKVGRKDKKVKIQVKFSGRTKGAIGIFQNFTVELEMPKVHNSDDVRIALYEAGYEHLSISTITPVVNN